MSLLPRSRRTDTNPHANIIRLSHLVQPGAPMKNGSYYIGGDADTDFFMAASIFSEIDAQEFAIHANSRNFHGHADWRLPTALEAMALLSLSPQILFAMGLVPCLRTKNETGTEKEIYIENRHRLHIAEATSGGPLHRPVRIWPIQYSHFDTAVSVGIATSSFNASADGTADTSVPAAYRVEHYSDGTSLIVNADASLQITGVVVRRQSAQQFNLAS